MVFSLIPSAHALAQTVRSVVGDETGLLEGLALYTEHGCGACHGADGLGAAAAPSLATGTLTESEFIAYVRQPGGFMPSYRASSVSDQALTGIYSSLTPTEIEPAPPGSAETGATLYRQTGCYQCHANEGQGGAQGPRLGPDPLSLTSFVWYVRNPSGGMPPYTDVVMSDQDLADIHAFLQARAQPPPVDAIPLLAP